MTQGNATTVRIKSIRIVVNTEEHKSFKALANEEHKSLGQLIRELLYGRLEAKKGVAA